MIQILQVIYLLLFGQDGLGLLAVFFIFSMTIISFKKSMAVRYRFSTTTNTTATVSAIVPFYGENPSLLRKCLESIRAEKIFELITVSDNPKDIECRDIAQELSTKLITFNSRKGKRFCLSQAFKEAKGEFVVFVDSDCVLESGTIQRMLASFTSNVAGVGTRHKIFSEHLKSLQGVMSQFIEDLRFTNDRALSQIGRHLVCIDGRCAMYKANIIRPYIVSDKYYNEKIGGQLAMIGDDRQLTRYCNRRGYQTVLSSGIIHTASPPTLKGFLRQQLRWMRSGWYYFVEDVKEGMAFMSLTYFIQSISWFPAALAFIVIMIIEGIYVPFSSQVTLLDTLILLPLGILLIAALRQTILVGRPITTKYIPAMVVVGIFAIMPLMIYSMFTTAKSSKWLTR